LALLVAVVWLATQNKRLSYQAKQATQKQVALTNETLANDAVSQSKQRELEGELAALREQGSAMQTRIEEKQHELDTLRNAQRSSRKDAPTGTLAMFVLQPGLTRGTDEPEKLIVSPAARSIQLQLLLEREEDYPGYVAEIRTARGNLVWSKGGLKLQRTAYGQSVSFTIPANQLPTGEYEIALKGGAPGNLEALEYYYIIALKK
jgi:hypothetical protein